MKKERNKKNLNGRERAVAAVLLFTVAVTLFVITALWYMKRYNTENILAKETHRTYKYHYMLIESEPDSSFFKSLYEGAKKTGKEQDIYVEDLAAGLDKAYSVETLMEIAIAANVDGIIVAADSSQRLRELIDKASEQNIPVVTTYEDSKESKRKSFVGINGHQLGEIYGSQILELKQPGIPLKAAVLVNSGLNGEGPNLSYSGMKETIMREDVELEVIHVNHSDAFSAEEKIRSLVLAGEKRPDVLVCMNEIDTICAYQAVVDYNVVGKMKIIGNYSSPKIVSAIQKGVISSSIAIDAKEMGTKAVEALAKYKENKFTNEYETVDPQVITKENAQNYIEEDKNDE